VLRILIISLVAAALVAFGASPWVIGGVVGLAYFVWGYVETRGKTPPP
jgi:hypothetical protein